MSVKTIIELIEREAGEEAQALVADAERTARGLLADAEAGVAAQVSEALERHGPEIRAVAQRRINEVRLRVLEERARLDAERLRAAFDVAAERVEAIADGGDPARWSAALEGICRDALDVIGEAAVVRVRRRDVETVRPVAAEHGARVEEVGDSAPTGVVAASADGRMEVDGSLPVRLERARLLLAGEVARMLVPSLRDEAAAPVEPDAAPVGG